MESSNKTTAADRKEQILQAIQGLRKFDSLQEKKLLEDNDIRLQFSLFKIPNRPEFVRNENRKLVKIVLPHVPDDEDVCLFVGDGSNKENREKIDETIQQYEEKLKGMGITRITEIIPVLKLKLEYQGYESRRVLSTRFDSFLADDKICRYLPDLLGKSFFGNGRTPVQVRVGDSRMEKDIKKALHTKICKISLTGCSNSMPIARLGMDDTEILENVQSAITKICEQAPGGSLNLQQFSLTLDTFPALPIYVSTVDRSAVPVPGLPSKPNQGEDLEMEEVSTIEGKVSVGKDGTITILRKDGHIKQVIGGKSNKSSRKRSLAHAKKFKASEDIETEGVTASKRSKRVQEDILTSTKTSTPTPQSTQNKVRKTPKATPDYSKKSPATTTQAASKKEPKSPADQAKGSKTPATTTPGTAKKEAKSPVNRATKTPNKEKTAAIVSNTMTPLTSKKMLKANSPADQATKTPKEKTAANSNNSPATMTPTTSKKALKAKPAKVTDQATKTSTKENVKRTPAPKTPAIIKTVTESIETTDVGADDDASKSSQPKRAKRNIGVAPKTPATAANVSNTRATMTPLTSKKVLKANSPADQATKTPKEKTSANSNNSPATMTPTTSKKALKAKPAKVTDQATKTSTKENVKRTPAPKTPAITKTVTESIETTYVGADDDASKPSQPNRAKRNIGVAPKTPATAKKMRMKGGTPSSNSSAQAKENLQKLPTPKADNTKTPKTVQSLSTKAAPVKKTPPSIRKTRNATKKLAEKN